MIEEHNKNMLESQSLIEGRSFFIFGPLNGFRLMIFRITSNNFFDGIIISMIAISSIMLALDNPLNDPNGILSKVLNYSDYVFTSIFAFELILRFIVHGVLFNGEKSYLRNSANIMDFMIVALSILSLSLSNVNGL